MRIKYHRLVFTFFLICAVAVLALHIYGNRPRDSLLDYALTLEDGQFVSDAGALWRVTETGRDDRLYVERVGEVSKEYSFTTEFKNSKPEELLPHELAMELLDHGRVFIRNDGSIWRSAEYFFTPQRTVLRPVLSPGEPASSGKTGFLNILTETKKYYAGDRYHIDHHYVSQLNMRCQFIGDKDSTPLLQLYIQLGDTWYKSMQTDISSVYRIPSRNGADAQFNYTEHLYGFAFCITLLDGPYEIRCRAEVSDAITGELLAAQEFDMFR